MRALGISLSYAASPRSLEALSRTCYPRTSTTPSPLAPTSIRSDWSMAEAAPNSSRGLATLQPEIDRTKHHTPVD
jgi:hypothetical protein